MKKLKFSKKVLKSLPESAGVYLFWNLAGKVIYVGKAKNLKNRLSSYFSQKLGPKTAKMIDQAKKLSFLKTISEFEALLLEAELVRKKKPIYNVQLKDDKSPIYISISKDEYRRVLTLRRTQLTSGDLGTIFGPYTKASIVKSVLRVVRKIIPYATHLPAKRACLESQIGLCQPCPSLISKIKDPKAKKKAKLKYQANIGKIKKLLKGDLASVRRSLEREMGTLAKREEFEKAEQWLTKIQMLDYLATPRTPAESYLESPNLAEDIRREEINQLKKIINSHVSHLKIRKLVRIECFDVAHLSGTYPAASMVSFLKGEPEKRLYRHFRLRRTKMRDDLSAMKEVIQRRIKHFSDWGKPDLIVVDGGKGQVAVADQLLAGQVAVAGLAKKQETLVIKTKEGFKEIKLPPGPAKNLMVRLRNEAHRFAQRYHHQQVARAIKEA